MLPDIRLLAKNAVMGVVLTSHTLSAGCRC